MYVWDLQLHVEAVLSVVVATVAGFGGTMVGTCVLLGLFKVMGRRQPRSNRHQGSQEGPQLHQLPETAHTPETDPRPETETTDSRIERFSWFRVHAWQCSSRTRNGRSLNTNYKVYMNCWRSPIFSWASSENTPEISTDGVLCWISSYNSCLVKVLGSQPLGQNNFSRSNKICVFEEPTSLYLVIY